MLTEKWFTVIDCQGLLRDEKLRIFFEDAENNHFGCLLKMLWIEDFDALVLF